jgi:hypothetical protein
MTIQMSAGVRNARLDAIETTIGTAPIIRIYTGAQPADCATANSGTLLVQYTLASDWASNAAGGTKGFSNLPLTTTATTSGTAGHYRIYHSSNTTSAQMQGSVGQGTGDLQLDNTSIQTGQTVNITAWTLTDGNA